VLYKEQSEFLVHEAKKWICTAPFTSVKEEISYAVNRVGGFEVKWPHRGRLGYRKVGTNFFYV
jgi:hypothetical protein